MTEQSKASVRREPSGTEEGDPGSAGDDADYEWAEFNLPVFPLARKFFRDDPNDEPDFISLVIDADPQPFGDS